MGLRREAMRLAVGQSVDGQVFRKRVVGLLGQAKMLLDCDFAEQGVVAE